jgi:hypothetical protein
MYGEELITSLSRLVANFEEEAVPTYGRYVKEPARANKNGVQYIPERAANPQLLTAVALIGAVAAFAIVWNFSRKKKAVKEDFSLTDLFSNSFGTK